MIGWFERHYFLSWAITVIISVSIFVISSIDFGGRGISLGYKSFIYHFFAFFFLNIFLLISSLKGRKNRAIFSVALILSLLYSILDELHQFYVPGRACSYLDVLTNSSGILFSGILYLLRINFTEARKPF